jgi:DNA-binding MarR family transcriptional regulator
MILSTIPGMGKRGTAVINDKHHQGDEPHLLREVVRTYQVLMAGFSRKTGMPASRFALMRPLAVAENDVGIMDLARQLGINAAAVTRQVQELERDVIIRRRADSKDKRRSYVSLSPKGRRIFGQIHGRTHELECSLASVLGEDEMRRAAMLLTKLRTLVESHR